MKIKHFVYFAQYVFSIATFVTKFIIRHFKFIADQTKMNQDEEQLPEENENFPELNENEFEDITDNSDDNLLEPMEEDDDSENFYKQELIEEIADMRQMFKQQYCDKTPKYSFKPLQLVRCHYKHRNLFSYPIARSGHRIIASESHLYSLGGYNPNRPDDCMLFQELWAYNFATSRWKLLLHGANSDMPTELASNALVIYNNVLIVSKLFHNTIIFL